MTIVKILEVLSKRRPGSKINVLVKDEETMINLPIDMARNGHFILSKKEEEDAGKYTIKRGSV